MPIKFGVRNQKGFSLVEVLAVLAVGGLLLRISVPAYCKYVSQAKQAQAKATLSAIYAAEMSFLVQSGSFTACLGDIGISTKLEQPTAYYAYGFKPANIPGSFCGTQGNETCFTTKFYNNPSIPDPPCISSGLGESYFNAALNMDSANTTVATGNQLYPKHETAPYTYVAHKTFFAMAVGNISSCNSDYDRWSIDQTKNLYNDTPTL
jgi:prepilin-type N-terminal cleavage/methylation domain-containing protein